MTPERKLWATVAMLTLTDARARVAAAKRGRRTIRIDNDHMPLRSYDGEVAAAREYFQSSDWDAVALLAGLDDAKADGAMAFVEAGVKPGKLKRKGT